MKAFAIAFCVGAVAQILIPVGYPGVTFGAMTGFLAFVYLGLLISEEESATIFSRYVFILTLGLGGVLAGALLGSHVGSLVVGVLELGKRTIQ